MIVFSHKRQQRTRYVLSTVYIEADVYRVKLKNNIIDVGNEWKALIKNGERENKC